MRAAPAAQGRFRPRRGGRFLAPVAAALLLVPACQGSEGSRKDREPDPASIQWVRVPQEDTSYVFHGLQPLQVTATSTEFLVLGVPYRRTGGLYGSRDGRTWYETGPEAAFVDRVAATADGATLAGTVPNADTVVPAVWRSTGKGKWGPAEILAGGGPSDEVLGLARGPRGTVVVAHDGGPFGEEEPSGDSYRGESLRLWTAADGGSFGRPHVVPCPVRPALEPQVSVLADAHGFVVSVQCTDDAFESKRVVLTSADGKTWKSRPELFRGELNGAGATGPRGSVLISHPESSDEEPGVYVSTFWSRGGEETWTAGEPMDVGRLPDRGVTPRKLQSVNGVSAVTGGYIASGRALDPLHGQPVGALWTSADGRRWTKAPTGKNLFHEVYALYGAAELDGTVIALGVGAAPDSSEEPAPTRLWIGRYGARPALGRPSGLAPFVGTWTWSHGSIVIDPEGRFTYRWRLYRDCATEPAPCDNGPEWGGKATGKLAPDASGRLRGRLETTNRPDEEGYRENAAVELRREPYGAIRMTVAGRPHGIFCSGGEADSRCVVSHG
ncbi:hypothetical protein ACPCAE_21250 [Streptomyces cinereoruber]|uniref:hypothetical protein n=1 Tax=Streptomyces cinereoruber TaxID=67260 RepID=UPI003C2B2DBC